jgi:hypothetical protein
MTPAFTESEHCSVCPTSNDQFNLMLVPDCCVWRVVVRIFGRPPLKPNWECDKLGLTRLRTARRALLGNARIQAPRHACGMCRWIGKSIFAQTPIRAN